MTKPDDSTDLVTSEPHVPAPASSEKILDRLYEDQVMDQAQSHMPDAIKVLVKIMKKGKSEATRRLCANDLIEHGHKRRNSDALSGLLDDGKLQIQVNLITFESSEHGREIKQVASRVVDEIPAALEPPDEDEVIEVEPVHEVVLTNPAAGEDK